MLCDPPEWPVSIYRTWIVYFQALSRIKQLAKHQGHTNDGFKYYQKSVKNIVKDENVTVKMPVIVAPNLFLHNPGMKLIEEWHQEAYKLLSSFKSGAQKWHPNLNTP